MKAGDYGSELLSYLRDLLSGTGKEVPSPSSISGSYGRLEPREFETRLKEMVAGRPEGEDFSIHFMGFGSAQKIFDEKWDAMAGHALAVAGDIIEKRLGRTGVFAPYKDDGFIVALASSEKKKGRLKCGLIGCEISKSLFGRSFDDHVDVMTATVDKDGKVTNGWLDKAEGAPADSDAQAGEEDGEGEGTPFIYDEVARRYVRLEEFEFVYRPMWQIKNKVVSSYLCIPARLASDGRLLFAGAAMPMPYASQENAALDILALRHAVGDLKRLLKTGRRLVIVVPVHYVTVHEPRNHREFLTYCNSIPEDCRNLLVFELIGLPAVLPSAPLVHTFSALRPFSRAVLVRQRFDSPDSLKLRSMGVYGVGVDVGNYNVPEEQIIKEMNDFNKRMQRAGFSTHAHGLNTVSLISSAVGAGFSLIDGDPVMSLIDEPDSVSPFDVRRLYASLLANQG